jgi:hypothetical protein
MTTAIGWMTMPASETAKAADRKTSRTLRSG